MAGKVGDVLRTVLRAKVLLFCCAAVLLYCCTVLPYCYIRTAVLAAQLYCGIAVLRYCGIAVLHVHRYIQHRV
jgi:hypothetical protein